ncbi:methyltransferase type 11 [Aphanothece hegewaldii CCALA 016]|uniref:Methyltransferase type 11 n=1 Tax=Aphanothece hegewaldii CCALA 016 TaxID=2107694 RepID=A0A2T1M2P1_9CHRO|nr:methyltransferase domain-containing protein [Aphanothece hegewaldii]PSF39013.1 methyltransferase type 11 [Aphanothece hegewaldii CCALA 016]
MIENKVSQQYNQLAKIYDSRWKKYINDTLTFLQTCAEISPNETVLDVACGTGEFERLLLSQHSNLQIIGVDISENMLAIAQDKCSSFPQVSFQLASAKALPFADNSFDVIVSASSFHYFDEPLVVLAEMRRVLKPEGKVIILDWCKDFLFCQILDIFLKFFDDAHEQCYTEQELHNFLKKANFVIYRSTKVRFGLVWGLMAVTSRKN